MVAYRSNKPNYFQKHKMVLQKHTVELKIK